jgi:uncharacterized phage-associated protein
VASQAGFSSRAIANYFIDRSIKTGDEITHMKLQKLTYIAHGWCLALLGRPLIRDSVEAWEYGPVYPGLYHELKEYGKEPIQRQIHDLVIESETDSFIFQPASINMESDDENQKEEITALLDKVWEVYKTFTALQLSSMTHEKGTPWEKIVSRFPEVRLKHVPIPDELIKKHYVDMAQSDHG